MFSRFCELTSIPSLQCGECPSSPSHHRHLRHLFGRCLTFLPFRSAASPYADYRSTNPPWLIAPFLPGLLAFGERTRGVEYASWCDLAEDRYIGHLSRANIVAAGCATDPASPAFMACNCSDASAAASRLHVGMMPIAVPIFTSPSTPGAYPSPPELIGHWFSHPARGRCALGARVGWAGCTWQRAPRSDSIYWDELRAMGWDTTPYNTSVPDAHQPTAQTKHNVAVFRRAWAAKRLPPCGG